MQQITQDQVKDLFEYREDGFLVRKRASMGNGIYAGRPVGNLNAKALGSRNTRYVTTKIQGQHWCVHKLIYLYHHGHVPEQLDHINGNSLDNRIENLRPATSAQNMSNRKIFSNNTSGCKGVNWNKRNKKWQVSVGVNKKQKHIGYFDDFELAELVALEARDKYHGNFANTFKE